ncbi:glycosyltransferase family 2 protein [Arcicella sp. LKC2W]|uniref:glycosyltransferase family 2 protein n=1 Tax=Arcicella sp. LKC2W TaxID=2984198 RepID=UPI002B202CC4|nr:glycosyltransferase family 2 protein [Arcicella sp. LKC2W]MEA5458790.1 glycosyltransferase family 2 protein [Arcicella sp. LKC2W]
MTHISTISIALCTHNGGKFIGEQLRSIQEQSLKPNEIIVCDDNSSDETVEIIKQFSEVLPIKFYQNIPALGTVKNFEYAISICKGDFIFLCDQDDYWLPNKIEKLVNYLETHPTQDVVFSNAAIVDENLQSLNLTMWEKIRFEDEEISLWEKGKALELLLISNRVTGCTVAIRKSFAKKAIPFPTHIHPDFIHDGWIALLASLTNQIGFINEPLVLYRQHDNQQVGIVEKEREKVHVSSRISRPRQEKLKPFLEKELLYTNLLNHVHQNYPELKNRTKALQTIAEHYQVRGNLEENRWKRLFPILRNFYRGNYHRYQHLGSDWYGVYLALLGDLFE